MKQFVNSGEANPKAIDFIEEKPRFRELYDILDKVHRVEEQVCALGDAMTNDISQRAAEAFRAIKELMEVATVCFLKDE